VNGAIAAGHPCTARAGADVLAAGGNAVDACVAAAFAAFAAEGPLTGPAGGGFLLVRSPGGETVLLDCFFAVPSRPEAPMEELVIDFADASTQVFHVGEASVAVPGLLAGLDAAHRRFGRLAWPDVVEPAVALARAGVPVNEAQAFLHEILVPILQREEGGRRIYGEGATLRTDDLVPTLEVLRDEGAAAAHRLLPELADDLRAYEVRELVALTADLGGVQLVTTPAPSIGGAIVRQALEALLQAEDADARAQALGDAYGAPRRRPTRVTGTTHVSVIDGEGRVAALSATLGSGSGVFRHGFQLNNMLGELDVIGHVARAPAERLPSMMAPTVLLEGAAPRLVVGSAGSVRLAGAIAQVARNVVAGMPVADAVAAPRLHVDGGTVHLEGGYDPRAAEGLEAAGWQVVQWSGRNLFFGGASAVERRSDGTLAAAGDPRRGGAGLVVP
jgi:gamma-glutamyltranspeptidase/glutathione hydrolase